MSGEVVREQNNKHELTKLFSLPPDIQSRVNPPQRGVIQVSGEVVVCE